MSRSIPLQPLKSEESVDIRMVALMRTLLAFSALAIIYVDPTEPARLVALTYLSLGLYFVYSGAIYLFLLAGKALSRRRALHWIDVCFYVYLVGLTAGTSSIFFFFFFFAILVASFSEGYREGLAVTIASVLMFTVVGLLTSPSGAQFELDRALIRPVYLFIIGYMMAHWGGHEAALRRRLMLLKEVGSLANPRYGLDRMLAENLRRLLVFFGAESCVLVRNAKPGERVLYRIDGSTPLDHYRPQQLTGQAADALLALPPSAIALHGAHPRLGHWKGAEALAWDAGSGERVELDARLYQNLANLLESSCYATVPYRQHAAIPSRLFIASAQPLARPEVEFLAQAVDQIAAVAERLELLEELMDNATQLARSRISRDIHDTAIQPYIGLKLGLEALYRQLEGTGAPGVARLSELVDMSRHALEDLRAYTARLRSGTPGWSAEGLLAGLTAHADRYRKYYGIEVQLMADGEVHVPDRLAAEAHQIVCEGLSNVYRHTGAKRAFVKLRSSGDWLHVEIGNERDAAKAAQVFTPRSITERAATIGGSAAIALDQKGYDVVRVSLPLVIGYDSVPKSFPAR